MSNSDFWIPHTSCMCSCMHMNLYMHMYMYQFCPGDTLQLCCCVSVSLGESLHLSLTDSSSSVGWIHGDGLDTLGLPRSNVFVSWGCWNCGPKAREILPQF